MVDLAIWGSQAENKMGPLQQFFVVVFNPYLDWNSKNVFSGPVVDVINVKNPYIAQLVM